MRVKSYIVRVLCMSSLICLSVGPVALLYITTALIRAHKDMSLYEPDTCDVVNMTSVSHPCRCGNQSHGCTMKQSCVEVKVKTKVSTMLLRHTPPSASDSTTRGGNYTLCTLTSCDQELTNKTRSSLDDSLNQPCTSSPCDPKSANQTRPTMDDLLKTINGTSQQNMTCYVNPNDPSHALWRMEHKQRMLMWLVWPLVTIATGLFFAVLARICTHGMD